MTKLVEMHGNFVIILLFLLNGAAKTANAEEIREPSNEVESVAEEETDPHSVNLQEIDDLKPDTGKTAGLILELAVFVDNYQWQVMLKHSNFDRDAAIRQTKDVISAMVGHAQAVYRLPNMRPQLELSIVHHEIWEEQPAAMSDENTGRNGDFIYGLDRLGDSFTNSEQQKKGNWDAAILITRGWCDYATGVTIHVGGACTQEKRGAVVLNLNAHILAHELYHLVGAGHDWDDPKSTWAPAKNQFSWSAKKIWSYHNFLKNNEACLRTTCPLTEYYLPVSSEPGRDFPPDLQCALVEAGAVSRFNDVGSWCGYEFCTSGKLQFATLYKTPCGDQKYCEAVLKEGFHYEPINCSVLGDYSVSERYNFAYGICLNENYHLPDGASAQPTLDDCAKLCDDNDQCKAFGYIEGNCFLYSHNCFEELNQPENKANEFYINDFDFTI